MSDSAERNCDKCIHHINGYCDSWDCNMQTVEDVKKEAINEYVKAVVEELSNADPQEMMSEEQRNVLNYAIEIVKQSVISDDVCEWESVSDGEFIQNPHTKRLYSNEPSMQNVYCNTCGKKIKIVGD